MQYMERGVAARPPAFCVCAQAIVLLCFAFCVLCFAVLVPGITELLTGFGWSTALVTLAASVAAGAWRVFITPVDTIKTMMQVCICL